MPKQETRELSPTSNIRIAIVDDDADASETLAEDISVALEPQPLLIDRYTSPKIVLDQLQKGTQYQLCVVDYRMPEMNGDRCVREIRHLLPDAIIIGLSTENVRDNFLESGANFFKSRREGTAALAEFVRVQLLPV